jgi:hypothetical protein
LFFGTSNPVFPRVVDVRLGNQSLLAVSSMDVHIFLNIACGKECENGVSMRITRAINTTESEESKFVNAGGHSLTFMQIWVHVLLHNTRLKEKMYTEIIAPRIVFGELIVNKQEIKLTLRTIPFGVKHTT